MKPAHSFSTLASETDIQTAAKALRANGMHVIVVDNGNKAKEEVLKIIPEGAQVFTMTSVTLEATGIAKEINESGKFDAVRPKLASMDTNTQGREMARMGATPQWAVGSVHAVTLDGNVLIASNSGSQLPAYASAAEHVVWVVGSQKIVQNVDVGLRRIYEYCLPLESERAQKAYGVQSNVGKILAVNKEAKPGRITVVLVKEKLGF